MFVIEDEWHCEWVGEYGSREEAYAELRRLEKLPWNEAPNLCPCMSWRTCGWRYHIVEFDTSSEPWRSLSDEPVLEVSAQQTRWLSASSPAG